jgi:hypothetical protein
MSSETVAAGNNAEEELEYVVEAPDELALALEEAEDALLSSTANAIALLKNILANTRDDESALKIKETVIYKYAYFN